MRTVQGVLTKYPGVGPAATIWVDPGTYSGNVVIDATHAGLRIQGAGPGKTVFDGGKTTPVFVLTGVGTGGLSGLTIQNGLAQGSTTLTNSGGGIRICDASTPLIANCIVKGCSAVGGAIYVYNASPRIENCVVYGNTSNGGAIRTSGGDVSIVNCTVANNNGAGIWRTGVGTVNVVNSIIWEPLGDDLNSCTAYYCCTQDGDTMPGGISADPLFVNAAAGDYHLSSTSPCINAGTSTGTPTTDIEGTFRDALPDMGAYEHLSGS